MTAMQTEVIWAGTIPSRLKEFGLMMAEKLEVTMHVAAEEAEAWAKANAPWTDQTGKARDSLHAFAVAVPGKTYSVEIAHGVPYGIYLETRWQGKYSIIDETISHMGPRIEAMVRSLI